MQAWLRRGCRARDSTVQSGMVSVEQLAEEGEYGIMTKEAYHLLAVDKKYGFVSFGNGNFQLFLSS